MNKGKLLCAHIAQAFMTPQQQPTVDEAKSVIGSSYRLRRRALFMKILH
jgi:hypothetical protein